MTTPPPSIPTTTPPPTSTLRLLITRLSTSLRHSLSQHRPWAELLDRTTFGRPDSISDATQRIRKNFSYYRVNYTTILSIIITISLITHPLTLLFLLTLLAAWIFLYLFRPSDQPLLICHRAFSERETLAILTLATVVVVFLTNVGSVLISAVLVGLGVLCVHGGFKIPEDLFLDEQDQGNGGFLSFLGGAASSAAAAAAPTVPRV